ncbi:MAG: glycosyltransferase family 4 protein [Neisseria sp.]|nr:glycosyltransferase family 4 protein [Neisseria sp.]
MNIDIAINHFRPGGGMESYTFDLVRGLHRHGERLRVFAAHTDSSVPEYRLADVQRINQKMIPKKLRPFFFTKQLERQRGRTPNKLIACNLSNFADVYVCGGNHLGYLQAMGQQPNLLDRLTIRRGRSNYATARKIMAHSGLMQRELETLYGVPSEKIRTVYPPADTARFFPQPERQAELRRRFGFAEEDTVFLFPSTGHKRKGLDLLADFFEHTDLPVKLAVAGSPLPRPMKNVMELGFCREMPDLYRAADFTIMASLYEPFGLVGIESVLCGTRVVLADNMGCVEVLNDKAGFFFSRNAPETLHHAIEQAVALKQAGRHKIAEPLSAIDYAPDLESHITAMLAMLAD